MEEIGRRGMYAAVATNGWVFADIDKLRKARDLGLRYVEVSVDLAESIGVKRAVFFNFIPVGRGLENKWLDISPVERALP